MIRGKKTKIWQFFNSMIFFVRKINEHMKESTQYKKISFFVAKKNKQLFRIKPFDVHFSFLSEFFHLFLTNFINNNQCRKTKLQGARCHNNPYMQNYIIKVSTFQLKKKSDLSLEIHILLSHISMVKSSKFGYFSILWSKL